MYYNLGRIYLVSRGEPEKALDFYRLSIDLDPSNPLVWHDLGTAYKESGALHAAVEAYQRALAINPRLAGTLFNLGVTYLNQDRKEDAVQGSPGNCSGGRRKN